jgi:hypothetical protein
MKIYQVYRWDKTDGPKVTFYANKAEATQAAKTFIKETDIDGEIEVSVLDLPTKKWELIHALNSISATSGYYHATLVASYDSEEAPIPIFENFYSDGGE